MVPVSPASASATGRLAQQDGGRGSVRSPARWSHPAGDSAFYQGNGAADYHFNLVSGDYGIDVEAQYDPTNDPSNSGECFFQGEFQNDTTGDHSRIGQYAPIVESVPYHISSSGHLSAGDYELYVAPGTTCDWRFVVVPESQVTTTTMPPPATSVQIVSVRMYLVRGHSYTPVKQAAMNQTIDMFAFYQLNGRPTTPVKGRLSVKEQGRGAPPVESGAMNHPPGTGDVLGAQVVFSPRFHDVVGRAEATFTLRLGKQVVSRSISFMIVK